jgi:hypothetical protein
VAFFLPGKGFQLQVTDIKQNRIGGSTADYFVDLRRRTNANTQSDKLDLVEIFKIFPKIFEKTFTMFDIR